MSSRAQPDVNLGQVVKPIASRSKASPKKAPKSAATITSDGDGEQAVKVSAKAKGKAVKGKGKKRVEESESEAESEEEKPPKKKAKKAKRRGLSEGNLTTVMWALLSIPTAPQDEEDAEDEDEDEDDNDDDKDESYGPPLSNISDFWRGYGFSEHPWLGKTTRQMELVKEWSAWLQKIARPYMQPEWEDELMDALEGGAKYGSVMVREREAAKKWMTTVLAPRLNAKMDAVLTENKYHPAQLMSQAPKGEAQRQFPDWSATSGTFVEPLCVELFTNRIMGGSVIHRPLIHVTKRIVILAGERLKKKHRAAMKNLAKVKAKAEACVQGEYIN